MQLALDWYPNPQNAGLGGCRAENAANDREVVVRAREAELMRRALAIGRDSWEKNWPELHAALRGGIPSFVFARAPKERLDGIPVFCYHLVQSADLERDLAFLESNGYMTLSADGLLDHLTGARPAPARSVVLTFDDGHKNLHAVVFPLLRRFGVIGIAFVAPHFHDAVEHAPWNALPDDERPCSWQEIEEMHASGCVDVQSHTFEHRYLPRWPEPTRLAGIASQLVDSIGDGGLSIAEDMQAARFALETRLQKPIRHLAFPRFFGNHEAVVAALDCGYSGLWWGTLPGRPLNRAGDTPTHIVRLSGEFLWRLPGTGRRALAAIMATRHTGNLSRWTRAVGGDSASVVIGAADQ